MASETLRPVFKWPGGKYRLLDVILPELAGGKRLIEPFVGSGVVFLNARQNDCLLCDANRDIIEFYQALHADGAAFIERCREHFTPDANAKDVYLERRERFNALPFGAERAALFLYLNRHGYNGLVRYNAGGGYNVPFGRYRAPRFPEGEIAAFLARVRDAHALFACQDFRETLAAAGEGDVVYCDPPYIPLSATANFTCYAGAVFGQAEQEEVARLAEGAAARGARVVVSNHAGPAARGLYQHARLREFPVRRSISCNADKRENVQEVIAVFG